MSFKALRWAMSQQQLGLTTGAKIVLLVLADHHYGKADRAPFPSLDRIGRMACISSRTTVLKHLETLEGLGLIAKYGRGNRSNEYLLSGSPDFSVDVQLLNNESQADCEDGCPVSGDGCPVSDDGCSDLEQPLSKEWTRTGDLTRSSTKKENQASAAKIFSASEDKGYNDFLAEYPREPSHYEGCHLDYRQALERGGNPKEIQQAAVRYAFEIEDDRQKCLDPAEWLRNDSWKHSEAPYRYYPGGLVR